MDVVLKLREIRRLRNLSQKEVALRSGVGEKTLSSFETGQRTDTMKLKQFLALLNVYGLTPAEFFGAGVEEAIFGEMEQMNATEVALIKALRRVPDAARLRLTEKFVLMIEGADAASRPKLRAVI